LFFYHFYTIQSCRECNLYSGISLISVSELQLEKPISAPVFKKAVFRGRPGAIKRWADGFRLA
jgi:hypothetical protein